MKTPLPAANAVPPATTYCQPSSQMADSSVGSGGPGSRRTARRATREADHCDHCHSAATSHAVIILGRTRMRWLWSSSGVFDVGVDHAMASGGHSLAVLIHMQAARHPE